MNIQHEIETLQARLRELQARQIFPHLEDEPKDEPENDGLPPELYGLPLRPDKPNRLATNSAYRLNPTQCPNCHKDNCLDGGDEDYEARSIAQHVTCNACGYEWDEVYQLTHYENMTNAYGEPVEHDPAAYSADDFKHPHPERYPIYTESDNDLPPGLYLALYNGWRDYVPHSSDLLDDMGFNGPVIGPLAYCQTTYGRHIKMEAAAGHSLAKFFPPEDQNDDEYYDLDVDIEGYVWHDGCDYGDWVLVEWLTTNNYEINETPPSTIAPPSPPAPNAWPNLTPGAWTVENVKQIMPEVRMVIPGEDGQWAAELSQDPDDPDKAIVTVTTTDILLVPWVNVAAAINANRPLTESDEFDMAPT